MSLEEELTAAFIEGYRVAGREVGYWGRRFLQAVKRNGGLATAKRMLLPRNEGQRKGLDALLEANRSELSVESIVLQPKFRSLFSAAELTTAQERLGEYGKTIAAHIATRQRLFPDELEPGKKYVEGAKKQVRVNAYESAPKARKAEASLMAYRCGRASYNPNRKLPVAVPAQTTGFAEQLLPPGASAQRSLRRWPSGAVRDTESLQTGFHLSGMRHQLDWT